MAINWQQIIATIVATVGGGGVLLFAAAWLIRSLVSDRLAREAEKAKADLLRDTEAFKIQLKTSADLEIERAKAFLVRASRVHERQIDILQNLYLHLYEALALFQRQTSSGRFEGEAAPEEYQKLVAGRLRSASDELQRGRLLIPQPLAEQCDTFFQEVWQGQTMFSFARDLRIGANPEARADFWNKAGQIAHTKVPQILRAIEAAARKVIHGEPPDHT